jgi:transposase
MGRGKPIAAALPMSERQRRLLEQESRKRSTTHQNYVRIPILLRGAQGQSNSQISRELAISYTTVLTWRTRWQLSYATLLEYEKGADGGGVSDQELLREMLAYLQDSPRSGTPKRITLAEEQQIVALACTKPADHGVIMTNWTHAMLAQMAVQKGLIAAISPRYVGVILKKKPLTPP